MYLSPLVYLSQSISPHALTHTHSLSLYLSIYLSLSLSLLFNQCGGRSYEYLCPTYAFTPRELVCYVCRLGSCLGPSASLVINLRCILIFFSPSLLYSFRVAHFALIRPLSSTSTACWPSMWAPITSTILHPALVEENTWIYIPSLGTRLHD